MRACREWIAQRCYASSFFFQLPHNKHESVRYAQLQSEFLNGSFCDIA